jgi:hypothetical protein
MQGLFSVVHAAPGLYGELRQPPLPDLDQAAVPSPRHERGGVVGDDDRARDGGDEPQLLISIPTFLSKILRKLFPIFIKLH